MTSNKRHTDEETNEVTIVILRETQYQLRSKMMRNFHTDESEITLTGRTRKNSRQCLVRDGLNEKNVMGRNAKLMGTYRGIRQREGVYEVSRRTVTHVFPFYIYIYVCVCVCVYFFFFFSHTLSNSRKYSNICHRELSRMQKPVFYDEARL